MVGLLGGRLKMANVLLESGDALLKEDGGFVLLESSGLPPIDGGVAAPSAVFGGGVDAPTPVFGGGVASPSPLTTGGVAPPEPV